MARECISEVRGARCERQNPKIHQKGKRSPVGEWMRSQFRVGDSLRETDVRSCRALPHVSSLILEQ